MKGFYAGVAVLTLSTLLWWAFIVGVVLVLQHFGVL